MLHLILRIWYQPDLLMELAHLELNAQCFPWHFRAMLTFPALTDSRNKFFKGQHRSLSERALNKNFFAVPSANHPRKCVRPTPLTAQWPSARDQPEFASKFKSLRTSLAFFPFWECVNSKKSFATMMKRKGMTISSSRSKGDPEWRHQQIWVLLNAIKCY